MWSCPHFRYLVLKRFTFEKILERPFLSRFFADHKVLHQVAKMLHKFSDQDLPAIIAAVEKNLDLTNIHACAIQALHGILPESPTDFYADRWPSPKIWMVIKRNRYIRPTVMIWEADVVSENDVKKCVQEFLPEMLQAISYHNEFWYISSAQISEELQKQMHALGEYPYVSLDAPARAYYMNNEQIEQLQHLNVSPPPGFHFVAMDPDVDAKTIVATSQYSSTGDEDMFRARLRALPSCAIAPDGEDRPVAFELNDGFGFMHLQYTFPEYRRLGLGTCIELRLAQENVKFGIRPCKGVALTRPHVMAMSERSPYWSTMQYDGRPMVVSYKAFSKFEKPVQIVC